MAQDEFFGNNPSMWHWGWRWGAFRYGFFDDSSSDSDDDDSFSENDGKDEGCESTSGGNALAILLQPGSPSTSTGEGKDWDAIREELRRQISHTVINVRGFCHAGKHGSKTYLLHELCAYNSPNDLLRLAIDINQKALVSNETKTNYLEVRDTNGMCVLHRACSNGNAENIKTVLEMYPQAAACERESGDARRFNGLPIRLFINSNISEVRGEVVQWLLDAFPGAAMFDFNDEGVGERFSSSLIRVALDRVASASTHYMSMIGTLLKIKDESVRNDDSQILESSENQMEECWRVLDVVLHHAINTHRHAADGLSSKSLLHYFLNLYYNWTDCRVRYDASLELPQFFIRRHVNKIMTCDRNGNLSLHFLLKLVGEREMLRCQCANNVLHSQQIYDLLETILWAGSNAVRVSNNQYKLPIHLALENGVCWGKALRLMVHAAPESLRTRDIDCRMYPFMIAAVATECKSCHCVTTLDTVFNLLVEYPEAAVGMSTG